jgi:hypothetical protein
MIVLTMYIFLWSFFFHQLKCVYNGVKDYSMFMCPSFVFYRRI